MARRRWYVLLGGIAAVGLAIRVGYILAFKDPSPPWGDASYYHRAADLLARGHGFIQPDLYAYRQLGAIPPSTPIQAADRPPGYIVALAVPSWLGFPSVLDHRLWSAAIGTTTVVVIGLAGRRIAGPAAGLIAAGLAAIYPNFWLNDGLVMSETLVQFAAAIVVLAAYHFHEHPGLRGAAVLGVATTAFVFTRAEGILLLGLLLPPLCLARRGLDWRRRALLLAVAGSVAVASLAPWTAYNLSRFNEPVLVSTGLGYAMATANCSDTYHGPFLGYWSYPCGNRFPSTGDASEIDAARRRGAIRYMSRNKGRLPIVVGARLGRTWGFFRPDQQLRLDHFESTRELPASRVGLTMYWLMIPAALAGAVILRRRGQPLSPMVSLALTVTLAVAITIGQTRYRAAAEVPLVLLTAVALHAWSQRCWHPRFTVEGPQSRRRKRSSRSITRPKSGRSERR